MSLPVIENDVIQIKQMRERRLKPRAAHRVDLVDRETRLFNDRRWSEWDRQDDLIAAAAAAATRVTPVPHGWLRRLLGW